MPNRESRGVIYILSNPSIVHNGLECFKIGRCKQNRLKQRIKELYTSGVLLPFKCEFAKIVARYEEVEKALHNAFSLERPNENREFFTTTPERIIPLLQLLDGEEITDIFQADINNSTNAADASAIARVRRPRLNFVEIGIPSGAIIKLLDSDNILAEVRGAHKVFYDGILYPNLTQLTKKLKNINREFRAAEYWEYQHKPLVQWYNEYHSQIVE